MRRNRKKKQFFVKHHNFRNIKILYLHIIFFLLFCSFFFMDDLNIFTRPRFYAFNFLQHQTHFLLMILLLKCITNNFCERNGLSKVSKIQCKELMQKCFANDFLLKTTVNEMHFSWLYNQQHSLTPNTYNIVFKKTHYMD